MLFGWLMFWIVGIAQPCCAAFAAPHADNHAISEAAMQSGSGHADAGMPAKNHLDDTPCAQAYAPDAAPGSDLLLPAAACTPIALVSVDAATLTAVPVIFASTARYHPPPPQRIYIRTQRLLI